MTARRYTIYSRPDLMRAALRGEDSEARWPREVTDRFRAHVGDHFVPFFWFEQGAQEAAEFENMSRSMSWELRRDSLMSATAADVASQEYVLFNVAQSNGAGSGVDAADARVAGEAKYAISDTIARYLQDRGATGIDLEQDGSGRWRMTVSGRLSGPGRLRWCVRSTRDPALFFFGMESFYVLRAELPDHLDFMAIDQFAIDIGDSFRVTFPFVLVSGQLLGDLLSMRVTGIVKHSEQPPMAFRVVEIVE